MSLFGVEIDYTNLSRYDSSGRGLPDKYMKSNEIGSADGVLEHLFGMNRQERKRESKLQRNQRITGQHDWRINRLYLMVDGIRLAEKVLSAKSSTTPAWRSWELLVLDRFLTNWILPSTESEHLVDKISDKDSGLLEEWLRIGVEKLLSWRKMPKACSEYIRARGYLPPLLRVTSLAWNKVQHWQELDLNDQQNVADAVYALSTPFGHEFLGVFLTACPSLNDYYSNMLDLKVQLDRVGTEDTAMSELESSEGEGEEALENELTIDDLYQLVADLAKDGLRSRGDIQYADRIEHVLNEHLPRLREQSSLSIENVRDILIACISTFEASGQSIPLSDFEHDDFLYSFRTVWLEYFNRKLTKEIEENYLNNIAQNRFVASLEHKTRLGNANTALDIASEIEKRLYVRLKNASFKEKRDLHSHLKDAAADVALRQEECINLETDGYNLLLPPGSLVDTLAEGHEVILTPAAYHPSAKVALMEWNWSPTAASSLSEIPPQEESSLQTALDKEIDSEAILLTETPENEVKTDSFESQTTQSLANIETSDDLGYSNSAPLPNIIAQPSDTEEPPEDSSLNQYLDIGTEAIERFSATRHPVAAENIALLWLQNGELPLAWKTLEVARRVYKDRDIFPQDLVNSAYLGMHVWRGDNSAVSRILQSMNQLSQEKIEEWIERRPGGRVVPYLVFASTFLPTIFTGNLTSAPRLLFSMAHYFDEPVSRLIEGLVSFSDHNNRLDVDALREQPKINEKDVRRALSAEIIKWHDIIIGKQTGWAAGRHAMRACLDYPEVKGMFETISKDNQDGMGIVKAFVDRFRDVEEQNRIMHSEVAKVQSHGSSAIIAGAARQWFRSNLDRAVEIADAWLETYAQHGTRTSEVGKFARKFVTMCQTALTNIEGRLHRTEELEPKAGLMVVRDILHNVCGLADGSVDPRWNGQRIVGWMSWPTEWLAASSAADEPEAQLDLLVRLLEIEVPFGSLILEALERRNFRHAYLLCLREKDLTGETNKSQETQIERLFNEDLRSCSVRCEQLKTTLDNANVASLIDDEEHYRLKSEVEHVKEQLVGMQVLDDLNRVHATLSELEDLMKSKFLVRTAELQTEFEDLVTRARVERGVEWLSDAWIEQVKAALDQNDTTVAEELLEHLKSALRDGTTLEVSSSKGSNLLSIFLSADSMLYEELRIPENQQKLTSHLSSHRILGLDFDAITSVMKKGLEELVALNRRHKRIDKPLYDSLFNILKALGMEMTSLVFNSLVEKKLGWQSTGKFAYLHLPVKQVDTGRGFVFFTEGSEEQMVNLILTMPEWTVSDLKSMLKDHVSTIHNRTIILSGRSLSNEERNAFARICKQDKMTLYLVDPVVLSTLSGLKVQDSDRIKTFLKLCLPWTYANPYTSEQMRPAVQEMRYGRRDAIRSLAQRDGAAMIFGGRQMGKSTLLQEARRVFHNPEINHFAYLRQMDGNLDRAKLSGDELDTHRQTVWNFIYDAAVESRFIKQVYRGTDEKIKAVRDFFQRNNSGALMVCLDEIDPILNLDAAHGFPIFRELSSLVTESKGRFKVIIAGLENVRRFADAPNYPLHQLGSAIQVTIMSPGEAIQLIKEPLGFLGYEFENSLLLNRILVATNRHPGLIHIFCHALVRRMADRDSGTVGTVTITSEDIEQVQNDPLVKRLIRDRFNITLTLDLRYKLIAYGVIEQGLSTFQASRAKAIVEDWAPDIFKRMTAKQFEAFLDELCGLGVFQSMQRSESAREYALRNTNILNLLGERKEIGEQLLETVEQMKELDPTAGHALSDDGRPSPLMLRDEALLISEARKGEADAGDGTLRAKSSRYSVGILIGSEALGLNAQWLSESLSNIGQFEPPVFAGAPRDRYRPLVKKDIDFGKAFDFKKLLFDSVIKVRAMTEPVMFFVEITGERPLSHTIDLIDVAHEARMDINPKRMRVRVVFLLSPQALWKWMSEPMLTRDREVQQAFIGLDLWKDTALSQLLSHLNMDNTKSSLDSLTSYSQRWYFSIDRLLDARARKQRNGERIEALKVNDFGQTYQPILDAKPKSQEEFLIKAGVMTTKWSLALLNRLASYKSFEADDLGMELMDLDPAFENADLSIPLEWLLRLHLIDAMRSEPSRNSGSKLRTKFRVTESIANAIRIAYPQDLPELA